MLPTSSDALRSFVRLTGSVGANTAPVSIRLSDVLAALSDEQTSALGEALWFFYAPDDAAENEQDEEVRAMRDAIKAVSRGDQDEF